MLHGRCNLGVHHQEVVEVWSSSSQLGYALPSKTSDKEDTVSESTSEESIQSGKYE